MSISWRTFSTRTESALLADGAGGSFAGRGVAVDQHQLGAGTAEGERGRPPDAVRRAGDEGNLAFEVHGSCLPGSDAASLDWISADRNRLAAAPGFAKLQP